MPGSGAGGGAGCQAGGNAARRCKATSASGEWRHRARQSWERLRVRMSFPCTWGTWGSTFTGTGQQPISPSVLDVEMMCRGKQPKDFNRTFSKRSKEGHHSK